MSRSFGKLKVIQQRLSQGLHESAFKLYERDPDPVSATALIGHAYKDLKDISLVQKVYNLLKASPTLPDNIVYSSVSRACQALGDASHITSLWNDITLS